ncbi:hypothetical protein F5Y14DRAFT_363571 [Nemania sp. NC0429]|nr:hypothetical protein F5Y14DRAFT_363571 [Nemania sp. NC0429]
MRGVFLGASALALAGMTNASVMRRWTYPDCEQDNCYRAMINPSYPGLAPSFCLEFLASTTTDAGVVPTPFDVSSSHAILGPHTITALMIFMLSARLVPASHTLTSIPRRQPRLRPRLPRPSPLPRLLSLRRPSQHRLNHHLPSQRLLSQLLLNRPPPNRHQL